MMDIHFTDEAGNEFFIRIDKDFETQVFKNKTQIEDVRVYPDEPDNQTDTTHTL
jgi:hypothetical protein